MKSNNDYYTHFQPENQTLDNLGLGNDDTEIIKHLLIKPPAKKAVDTIKCQSTSSADED